MKVDICSIYIGADHAGYALKESICSYLSANYQRLNIVDCGTYSDNACDFPEIAKRTVDRVLENKAKSFGILCCGSGTGMAIAANRTKGIRAANCWCVDIAKLAREHNDANVLVLAGRFLNNELAIEIVDAFLNSEFSELEKYSKRNIMLDDIN